MLTGSLAASLYSTPRMTRDVDVLIDPGREPRVVRNLLKKVLLEEFTAYEEQIDEAFAMRSMFNVLDGAALTKIDVIIRDPSRDADEIFQRRA